MHRCNGPDWCTTEVSSGVLRSLKVGHGPLFPGLRGNGVNLRLTCNANLETTATGGQLQSVRMRPTPHPPAICQNLRGGGGSWGGGGGWREGRGGGDWQLSRGEGLRATHYYHMHTSSVCVCVSGAMGV